MERSEAVQKAGNQKATDLCKNQMDIYITGPAGTGGALKLYNDNKEMIRKRFPEYYIRRIEKLQEGISTVKMPDFTAAESTIYKMHVRTAEQTPVKTAGITEAEVSACPITSDVKNSEENEITLAKNINCIYICTITDGGLFGALWDGCEKLKCGCEVFMEKIPVRQETVEITELTGDNPYEIESPENLLIFLDLISTDLDNDHEPDFFKADPTRNKQDDRKPEENISATEFNIVNIDKELNKIIVNGKAYDLYRIGRTTDTKDRVIIHKDKRRFLTPPQRQQTDINNRKNYLIQNDNNGAAGIIV